jgi:glycosyltransferase involved in cell wall biosynthesis
MKIVQAVGWYHPDSVGGTEIYVSELTRALRAAGHDVLVAAPDPGLTAPRTYTYDDCEIFRYPIPATPSRGEAQGEVAVRGAEYFHQWLSSTRADVVHIHTFVTGLGFSEIVAAREAGSRVIVTTHASSLGYVCQRGTLMLHGERLCDGIVDESRCADCALEERGAPPAVRSILANLPQPVSQLTGAVPGPIGTALGMRDLIRRNTMRQRSMLNAIEAFVVLTDHAAAIVRANGAPEEKIFVNRVGIRDDIDGPDVVSRTASDGVVRVGYVGRFEHVKGVLDLAAAMRRVPADVRVRLEFRGPAQSPADFVTKALISEACANDSRVSVKEGVPPAQIGNVLRSYDVICCPSRCLEGGPMVALEGMALGIPVIAASVGGVAEVVQDGVNARLVPPGDIDRLAAALIEVATNPTGTLCQWRKHLPPARRMRDVAREYLDIYSRN